MHTDLKWKVYNLAYFHVIAWFLFEWKQKIFHTFIYIAIPSVESQNVTIKSCLVCAKSREYGFLVTVRPLGSMRWEETKLPKWIDFFIQGKWSRLLILVLHKNMFLLEWWKHHELKMRYIQWNIKCKNVQCLLWWLTLTKWERKR